jgi:uncharacterized RDD family membrane protein YckC
MQAILDEPLIQQDNTNVKYGGFWPRFGALILDGIILSPISFGLTYYNITSWKSSALMILVSLIGIGYKPFMEFYYGATLGKMALKLKVTNLNFEKADLGTILLRNIFHILPTLLSLFFTVGMFSDPDFESISGYQDYLMFSQRFSAAQYISYGSGLITIVEAIMLAVDQQKRTLHDRIAGTFVIEKR